MSTHTHVYTHECSIGLRKQKGNDLLCYDRNIWHRCEPRAYTQHNSLLIYAAHSCCVTSGQSGWWRENGDAEFSEASWFFFFFIFKSIRWMQRFPKIRRFRFSCVTSSWSKSQPGLWPHPLSLYVFFISIIGGNFLEAAISQSPWWTQWNQCPEKKVH